MPGSEPVQSLMRGLDILLIVAQSGNGERLNDLSKKMNLNQSTVHNLVKSLRIKEFIEKGRDGRLRTGNVFNELMKRSSNAGLRQRVEDEMRNISMAFSNAIVTFSEIRNSEIIVTLRISPDITGMIQRDVGSNFHLYYNVSSLIHLAFADTETISWLRLNHPFVEEGTRYWQEEDSLMKYLADAKVRGYAKSPFDVKESLRLAVPVFSSRSIMCGSIGLSIKLASGDNARKMELDISSLLMSASKNISKRTEV